MKTIKVGLIGAGTVGSGLIQIINEKSNVILNRSGIQIILHKVCDANPDISKKYPNISTTTKYTDITQDKEIDLVVELVGGTKIAYDIVKDALNSSKTVVTANKALLSEKGQELFSLAQKMKVEIGYEASVGGTIPIAVGAAMALKQQGSKDKVWCFVGDMAFETGGFMENYKYAKNFDLPIQFVVEDNGVSTNTPTVETWKVKTEAPEQPRALIPHSDSSIRAAN
jgi:homoserine dehydrogenase